MVTIAHESTREDLAECLTHFAATAGRMLRLTPLGEENPDWAAKHAEINELLTAWETRADWLCELRHERDAEEE